MGLIRKLIFEVHNRDTCAKQHISLYRLVDSHTQAFEKES